MLLRVLRNTKKLAFGDWRPFSKISVVSQLLGVTLEGDKLQDVQLTALDDRLREVEGKFEALDTKVKMLTGGHDGE